MSKKLFITNMPYSITKDEFSDLFGPYGEISFIKLVLDDNGKARGFGFVEFVNETDGFNAIQDLNGSFIKNRKIRVIESNR